MNRILLLGLLITGSFSATATRAEDAKVFPGTMCKYEHKGSNDKYLDPANYKATGLRNTGSSTKDVVCPILRDSTAKDIEYIEVQTKGEVSCRFYNRSANGSSSRSEPADGTITITAGVTTYTFAKGSPNVPVPYDRGAIGLYCAVASGSVILSYRVDEL